MDHDDILPIDYHRQTNQPLPGELGPKPLCVPVSEMPLIPNISSPLEKVYLLSLLAPDGTKAACAGMDDDHEVAVINL